MIGQSLAVGKRVSLHHSDDSGWLIIGLPGLERSKNSLWLHVDMLMLHLGGELWTFREFKWLGKNHCTALLIERRKTFLNNFWKLDKKG